MRIRDLAAVAALLVIPSTTAVAQKTGDEARIIFTVSGAYIASKGLWAVSDQPVQDPPSVDTFVLTRNISPTFGVGFSGAYFPGSSVGFTGDLLLLGLGYDDSCRIAGTPQSLQNVEVCDDIEEQDQSAAAVTVSAGANFRFFSREPISPFLRANVGVLFSNQSSVLTQGVTDSRLLVTIYDDEKRSRVSPGLSLGAGATMAISRGYHLRWEVRDNIVGIEAVTGPVAVQGQVPPHERVYKHMFSVLIGVDVILERSRGRRY
jgi:opacity protein-like surface antigen